MNKALFLDRDGVINHDYGYVHKIEDFHFINGIFSLCHQAQKRGYKIIIVTNQAGIGRGYYTERDFLTLMSWVDKKFLEKNINITKIYFCPYHSEHGVGKYKKDSFDRKPNPGMLLQAIKEFDLDPKISIMLGDKEKDIEAGIAAKIGTNILYSSKDYQTSKANLQISNLTENFNFL